MSHSTQKVLIESIDRKIKIDGVIFQEHKKRETFVNAEGIVERKFSNTRIIGNRRYSEKQRIIGGEVQDETIETTMSPEEMVDFKIKWAQKWHRRRRTWYVTAGSSQTFGERLINFRRNICFNLTKKNSPKISVKN